MRTSSSFPHAADPKAMAERLMQRAHLRDGLPEIAVGLSFLVVSGLIYAQAAAPRESIGFKAAVITSAFGVPLLIFGSMWVLKWVRRRYLIERVGYVEHNPIGRKQIALGVMLAAVMTLALFGVVTRLSQPDRWLLAGTGLLGGALVAGCGRLPRLVIEGVLMATTGVFVAVSGVPLEIGFIILFGFQGLLTLVSGGIVFLRFLRQPIRGGRIG